MRSLTIASRQMVEIAKAVSYNSDVLIMDEPTSALTEREVDHLFAIIRTLKAAGKGIVYITHKMSELAAVAGRGLGVPRRPLHRLRLHCRARPRGHHPDDGGARARPDVPEAAGRDRRPGALGRRPRPLDGIFADVGFELRAGEILGVAGLVGSGRTNVAEALFGVTPATAGTIRIRGEAGADRGRRPRRWRRAWPSTEDRKETGLFLTLPVLENMQMAVLRDRYVKAGFVTQAARSPKPARLGAPRSDQDAGPAGAGAEPVGRQPAEGADRPLAADQAAHPDPGRADARHRCRREGGDLPADLGSWRRRAWRC